MTCPEDLGSPPNPSERRRIGLFDKARQSREVFLMVERSADWLRQASRDLEHARLDLKGGFYEWASFSAQQAAEKAVQGLLQALGAESWGHSVADLLGGLPRKMKPAEDLLEAALRLDKAYIPTRYPNMHPSGSPSNRYTRREGEELIEDAEKILRYCQDHLPEARKRRS